MQTPFVGDFDQTKLVFGNLDTSNNRTKVEIYRDNTSTMRNNRLNRFTLCNDANTPMETRWPLDSVREDGNPDRRGLAIKVTDKATEAALHGLDELIVRKALENSKEWFKKVLTEDQVRDRYRPLLFKAKEDDDFMSVKIKVKCPGSDYPTVLHMRDEDGKIHKKAGRIEHLIDGAKVVPHVSASYGLWFMGGAMSFGLALQAEEIIVTPGQSADDSLSHFRSSTPLVMAAATDSAQPNLASDEPPAKSVRVELVEEDSAM